jgi:hypothetical protein
MKYLAVFFYKLHEMTRTLTNSEYFEQYPNLSFRNRLALILLGIAYLVHKKTMINLNMERTDNVCNLD